MNIPISTITKLQFNILTPEKMLEMSVCEVYRTVSDTTNFDNTIFDPRLGASNYGEICPTCGNSSKECTGHFGHINLAVPIILPQYYLTLVRVLECVCFKCSNLILDEDLYEKVSQLPKKSRAKFIALKKKSKSKLQVCSRCNAFQPNFYKSDTRCQSITYYYKESTDPHKKALEKQKTKVKPAFGEDAESKYHILSNDIIYDILKRISPADAFLCGIESPHLMMMLVMPVPPMTMRPAIRLDDGRTSDDDLTHILNSIVYSNRNLQEAIKSNKNTIEDYIRLQNHVTSYIDNNAVKLPARTKSGRPLVSIRQRVSGKDGIFRSYLMGKRVDYSGRSVITPDPSLSIDQVGVPVDIAKIISYPEIVNRYNEKRLIDMLKNDPSVWPAVKYVQYKDTKIKLSAKSEKVRKRPLSYGDIVYRHLVDDDMILFNRQPSLHKMSMMAHRARITRRKTLTMNQNVTSPYNADFDGDEFNMHVPQSIATVTELFLLALSSTQMLSTQKHGPVIGYVQDSILGLYFMTKLNDPVLGNLIPYDKTMNLVGRIKRRFSPMPKPSDRDKNDRPLWDIKKILSMAIPPINYNSRKLKKGTKTGELRGIKIVNGQIGEGFLRKDELSAENGSIFHIIFLDYGPIVTRDAMDNLSFMANEWFRMNGFSANIHDLDLTPEMDDSISNELDTCDGNLVSLINEYSCEQPREKVNKVVNEYLLVELNDTRDKVVDTIMNSDTSDKPIFRMIDAGSKGKDDNMGQMMGLLGQQILDNTWIKGGFYKRTLPHVTKNSLDPYAHGYVRRSFKTGLSSNEYFYHAAAGRDGTISKSIKTAETGYIQRKLIKVFEGLTVQYDGTIRNESGHIIQQVYGSDGFDGAYHEHQDVTPFTYDQDEFCEQFRVVDGDNIDAYLTEKAVNELHKLSLPNIVTAFNNEYSRMYELYLVARSIIFGNILEKVNILAPIKLDRLIKNIKYRYRQSEDNVLTDLTPLYVIEKVKALSDKIIVTHINDGGEETLTPLLFKSLLHLHLSTKNIIINNRLTKLQFDYLLHEIYQKFLTVMITPGENIGIITAQSLGEPTTQMALDTFHNIGAKSEANLSKGVPRLKEILSLIKNIMTPSMLIKLQDTVFESEFYRFEGKDAYNAVCLSHIKQIQSMIKSTVLKSYVDNYDIIYLQYNKEIVTLIKDFEELEALIEDLDIVDGIPPTISDNNFLIRLQLNRMPTSTKANMINALKSTGKTEEVYFSRSDDMAVYIFFPHIASTASEFFNPIEELKTLYDKSISTLKFRGVDGVDIEDNNTVLDISRQNKMIVTESGKYVFPKDPDYKNYDRHYHYEFSLRTLGSNLLEVSMLPYVDAKNTVTNNIWEIYKIYGIEVARSCLINELYSVFSLSMPEIAPRHIELLADVMTYRGILVSVDRFGQNKSEANVISHATFEETFIRISDACLYNETDPMVGPSANIMYGQNPPMGTTSNEILMTIDPNLLPSDEESIQYRLGESPQQQTKCDMKHLNFDHTTFL